MWERSRFCPCHLSVHCLNRHKDDLSWGFAKRVLIINLLLSVRDLGDAAMEEEQHGVFWVMPRNEGGLGMFPFIFFVLR